MVLVVLACLGFQAGSEDLPARWVAGLGDDVIEHRAAAAARFDSLARDFEAAAGSWETAAQSADPGQRRALSRIRRAWSLSLADFIPAAEQRPRGTGASLEGTAQEDREVLLKMRSIRIRIDMTEAPLTAVVDHLREVSGINIHIIAVDDPDRLMVTARGEGRSLEAILRDVLPRVQMAYVVSDGVLILSPAERLRKRVKLELYDVQDLAEEDAGEALAIRIRKEVLPGRWTESEGRSIQYQNGLLIVRNSIDVHRSLRGCLERIRTGQPEDAPIPSQEWLAALFRDLSGPGAEAERRLCLLGATLSEALTALADAAASADLEVRLHAPTLQQRLLRRLGRESIRRLLETDDLRTALREFRLAWLQSTGFEDFDVLARHAFGTRARSATWIPRAVVDGTLITPAIGLVLWTGDAALIVRDGQAIPATEEAMLDPRGGTLIFTLPQELGERKAGEGPACVVVELSGNGAPPK